MRNKYTYAHENPILNPYERELIYKQVVNILFFIEKGSRFIEFSAFLCFSKKSIKIINNNKNSINML